MEYYAALFNDYTQENGLITQLQWAKNQTQKIIYDLIQHNK